MLLTLVQEKLLAGRLRAESSDANRCLDSTVRSKMGDEKIEAELNLEFRASESAQCGILTRQYLSEREGIN